MRLSTSLMLNGFAGCFGCGAGVAVFLGAAPDKTLVIENAVDVGGGFGADVIELEVFAGSEGDA